MLSDHTIIECISWVLLTIGLGLPLYLVPRFKVKGLVCGALVTWFFLLRFGEIVLGEGDGGPAAMGVLAWLIIGWLVSGLYGGLILIVAAVIKQN